MRKPRIFCPELSASSYKCTNIKQIHHLAKVLRLKVNDTVELFDGLGSFASGIIQDIGKTHINFHEENLLFYHYLIHFLSLTENYHPFLIFLVYF